MSNFWKSAEIISGYSRAQAIEDGVLVDLMQEGTVKAVREAGFTIPVAMTAAAFGQTVAPIDGGELPAGQDVQGRLWDVLYMLRQAVRVSDGGDTIRYGLIVQQDSKVPRQSNERRHGNSWRARLTTLKAVCGPADDGSPCITIMQQHED